MEHAQRHEQHLERLAEERGSSTLIMIAAGGSRAHVQRVIADHPHARVWTLNATRHEREELQFEIHAPAPVNALNPFVPAIVSADYVGPDFAPEDDANYRRYMRQHPEYAAAVARGDPHTSLEGAARIQFPLAAACELGVPFFELSHDYMLAYAALLHTAKLPIEARAPGVSMRPFERIVMCGVDVSDAHHFARSRGAHFWLGLLRGYGVELVVMPESTLLAGGVMHDAAAMTPLKRPYFYGQTRRKLARSA